jgi:hypothetical protein
MLGQSSTLCLITQEAFESHPALADVIIEDAKHEGLESLFVRALRRFPPAFSSAANKQLLVSPEFNPGQSSTTRLLSCLTLVDCRVFLTSRRSYVCACIRSRDITFWSGVGCKCAKQTGRR